MQDPNLLASADILKLAGIGVTVGWFISYFVLMIFYHCRYILFKKFKGLWRPIFARLILVESLLLLPSAGLIYVLFPTTLEREVAFAITVTSAVTCQCLCIFVGGALRHDLTKWRTETEEGVSHVMERFERSLERLDITYLKLALEGKERGHSEYTLVLHAPDLSQKDRIPTAEGVPVLINVFSPNIILNRPSPLLLAKLGQPDGIIHQSD